MLRRKAGEWVSLLILAFPAVMLGTPKEVRFSQSAPSVEAYDFVEVKVDLPPVWFGFTSN